MIDTDKPPFILDETLADVISWLGLKINTGSVSRMFAVQLMDCIKMRIYNVYKIYDEIGNLEGRGLQRPSTTKPATQFTKPLLKGLWHKHHKQPEHLIKNALSHIESQNGNAVFYKLWKKIASDSTIPDDKKLGAIAYGITTELLIDRSQKQKNTGEWIVYARQDERNYYLTLACHDEDDQTIRKRVFLCQTDFPHLNFYK